MYKVKNKKGISPLIATVLIIGFTIVLAALVITWGTKLFKTTVGQTESTSKFSLACTTGLNIDVTPGTKAPAGALGTPGGTIELSLRNNNQDTPIDDFQFLLYDGTNIDKLADAEGVSPAGGTYKLEFPVPKKYTLTAKTVDLNSLTKIEVYPVFTIDGVTKACQSPVEVKIGV